jgi:signal transduction histidine kinase
VKHHFLNSMHGRLFLLLMLGVAVSVTATLWLARKQHLETLHLTVARHQTDQIVRLVATLDEAPPAAREDWLHSLRGIGMRGRLVASLPPLPNTDTTLQAALTERLGRTRELQAERPAPCPPRSDRSPPAHAPFPPPPQCQRIQLHLSDGTPLQLLMTIPSGPPLPDAPPWGALLLFTASIATLAWLAARTVTRPLQQLAGAADRLDLAQANAPLPEQGGNEVRTAIRAFNRMQQRIRDDLRERTGMLAAITHDLQTPLTRLRLRLEKVSDTELREKLVSDMSAMQQMLQEGLELAHSLDASESVQRLDLGSLLDSLCRDASEAGQDVRHVPHGVVQVDARPLALRRALANLLDNAVKYGQRAEVSLTCETGRCRIRLHDAGPGIPADQLSAVFTPFFRLEHSRSRRTGGTGLGLSIARNIVSRHGGELTLRNHPAGGLEVEVTLPTAA